MRLKTSGEGWIIQPYKSLVSSETYSLFFHKSTICSSIGRTNLTFLILLIAIFALETYEALKIGTLVVTQRSIRQSMQHPRNTGSCRVFMSISGRRDVETLQGKTIDAGVASKSDATLALSSETPDSDVTFPPLRVLDQNEYYMVIEKPPSVVCHHSPWTGSKKRKLVDSDMVQAEIPILQRVRELTGRRVNLVHRLDRGSSGCLLLTYADDKGMASEGSDGSDVLPPWEQLQSSRKHINSTKATAILSEALADKVNCTKTYIAIVRGEGVLHGEDLKERGWFLVERAIKNENGIEKNASTYFRFIAGQHNGAGTIDRPRASLVLARPQTGRWHQIRKHLNGLSHPILGDTTHGSSRTNREWKELRDMPNERTCLHLSQIIIGQQTEVCPNGINVTCPLASDMMTLLRDHLPIVLTAAIPILKEEGILL